MAGLMLANGTAVAGNNDAGFWLSSRSSFFALQECRSDSSAIIGCVSNGAQCAHMGAGVRGLPREDQGSWRGLQPAALSQGCS